MNGSWIACIFARSADELALPTLEVRERYTRFWSYNASKSEGDLLLAAVDEEVASFETVQSSGPDRGPCSTMLSNPAVIIGLH